MIESSAEITYGVKFKEVALPCSKTNDPLLSFSEVAIDPYKTVPSLSVNDVDLKKSSRDTDMVIYGINFASDEEVIF
jgi:hypothetical protein